jgi:hypothetical protein
MAGKFFPNRALLWSFWSNVLFIFGMIGYFLMDGFDYMRPNTLHLSVASIIYVILAGAFVADSTLQLFSVYNTSRNTHRYCAMVFSGIFDKIGSDAYFLGALFATASLTNSNIVWTFNTIGVCDFVIGAVINMIVSGSSSLYSWANVLNLLGSLLYLLAILLTAVSFTQIIVILGDFIYVIDAILYTICWFSDRQLAIAQDGEVLLTNK